MPRPRTTPRPVPATGTARADPMSRGCARPPASATKRCRVLTFLSNIRRAGLVCGRGRNMVMETGVPEPLFAVPRVTAAADEDGALVIRSAEPLAGVMPGVLGDPGQQPPQRRDPPGADREADVRVVGGAGQLPGEVPGVGAHRHPARCRPRRQAASARRSRPGAVARGSSVPSPRSAASTASVSAQVATCGRPTRWPCGRYATPRFLAAVDLHVGSGQVNSNRAAGQR